jgi:uncharacterized membrane protein
MDTTLTTRQRIQSIDVLRGLIMIIMALDHTRDFFHKEALTDDPLNLATTTPLLYFTRWVTHLCAPVFVFLAGTSAWLQARRKTKKELSSFLITRGFWLILLEITVVNFGIFFDIYFGATALQTIWSIGISMVLLGLVIWLPFSAILTIGLLIVLGHNALDYAEAKQQGNMPVWWHIIHRPGFFALSPNHTVLLLYPFLPWTGLMIMGYCSGKLFTSTNEQNRRKRLRWAGLALLLLFVLLRASRIYGDPLEWSAQKNSLYSFFSFINVQKYPPSLLYMCATIGIALLLLSVIKDIPGKLGKIIMVYGRVPMFYYVLHFYLLSFIRMLLFIARGHSFSEGVRGVEAVPFKFIIPAEGYNLAGVYLIWFLVILALYPLCKWYDAYKTNHPQKKWLSYL